LEEAISAADANRRFSELRHKVKQGRSVLITSHGKPVARIVPAAENDQTLGKAQAMLAQGRRLAVDRR
jgi:prevent-host-death family protein